MTTIRKMEYKGWKNCIELSNGIVDLIATTDVGPRIIRFGFQGKENEFFEYPDQVGTTGGDEWKLYGGHRLWHSPESMPRTYEPDNSQISWEKKLNGVALSQPVEPWTQIKKDMEVTLSPESPTVTVLHRLTNKGAWPVELALWALTVAAPGGKEIIPQITKDTGLLPNRMLSLWPYTKMNDNRVYWGEKFIMLRQDKNAEAAFKIGLPNEEGWAAYANHGHLFVKQFPYVEEAIYPDYSASSYETYTNNLMLEMESLSPIVFLEPDDYIEHTEVWTLYDNIKVPETEKEVEENIVPLIGGKVSY